MTSASLEPYPKCSKMAAHHVQILELLPLAETVDKLRAVCSGCGGDAAFTQRISSEAQIEVRFQAVNAYMAAVLLLLSLLTSAVLPVFAREAGSWLLHHTAGGG